MTIKTETCYFRQVIDSWERIAVVKGYVPFGEIEGEEISVSDLPEGFKTWKVYTKYSVPDAIIHVLSPTGE